MSSSLRHLFHPDNADGYRVAIDDCADRLVRHLTATDGHPSRGTSPREAASRVAATDLDAPLGDTGAVLDELSRLWLDDTIWFHEPTYAAHLNCPIVIPALMAEVLISGVNASLDTFDQSVGGTFIERHLIDWTAERIGYDAIPDGKRPDGIFTTGGTQSNLQGLLLARGHAEGPREKLRIFASADGHFSVQKAARLLGLGEDAVIAVATDVQHRMDPQALLRALTESADRHEIPMAVVATAGTTDFGSIDPLHEIAGLARAHRAWFHVDAAYGGGLLISPRHRDWLAGIELADSVTIDFHKTWFQPVSCSALVVRDGATLGHVTWHADYLNPKDSAHPNQVDKSLQTTRRFEALKLWVSLRVMGADVLGGYLDDVIDLTRDIADAMRDMGDIELAADPQLSTLVFRYRTVGVPDREVDRINSRIRAELFDGGRAMVAATKVGGVAFLKFTLLNPKATADDILGIVELVRDAGVRHLARRIPGRDLHLRAHLEALPA
ncbi:MAG: aspartate aminotransferase family protein [Nocardioides sp.]|uniref:pyridoxal phosphate-dependent decarboxylase family protein n=1 Tax=Nocardioides sp. TaxID=35761 RepID=UPI0032662E0D